MNTHSYKGEKYMGKHIHVIDLNKIEKVNVLDSQTISDMALLFKMFSDPTRLKIMQALLSVKLNVCEIASLLNMTHSAISHQLSTLKMANLVKANKVGKEVYYSLADQHVVSIISLGLEHIQED